MNLGKSALFQEDSISFWDSTFIYESIFQEEGKCLHALSSQKVHFLVLLKYVGMDVVLAKCGYTVDNAWSKC